MPQLISNPICIEEADNKPKLIVEYIGRLSTQTEAISIAHMRTPGGWSQTGQRPDFDEFTIVLKGMLRVEYEGGQMDVHSGQAVITRKGEWVLYSTPSEEGAEYIAVCLPAFSPETAHQDT